MNFRIRTPRAWTAAGSGLLLVVSLGLALNASADNGNIGTSSIEIDTVNQANLYPSPATKCLASPSTDFDATPNTNVVDWVKDCSANTTDFSASNSAAQRGHLNGFRVVDGVAGSDQDIFLTGGKEELLGTWNPGPGTVGSSKYDITQAYIANNSSQAFFGMERRGNNGTTAFDWEFNRLAPSASNPDYIPTRSECDVLVTFEMQGSGSSGSAVPFLFRYDDPLVANTGSGGALDCSGYTPATGYNGDVAQSGHYVAVSAPGVVTSINNAAVHSAPWGTVDSKGAWTTGDIDRFQFAEASVPLSLLGISSTDVCSSVARYLQVRTRSSSTDTSDLKDLTKIKNFQFFAPVNPDQTLTTNCDSQFHFASSLQSGTPTWTFSIPDSGGQQTPVTLTGVGTTTVSAKQHQNNASTWTSSGLSGDVQVANFPAGAAYVDIDVTQTATSGSNNCQTSSSGTIRVYRGQSGSASATPHCDGTFAWSVDVSGGKAPYDLTINLQRQELVNGVQTWVTKSTVTSTNDADGHAEGSFDASALPGTWRVHLSSEDSQTVGVGGAGCVVTADSSTFQVRAPLVASASKNRANTNGATLTAAVDGNQTGALAGDTVAYQWQLGLPDGSGGTTWSDITGKNTQNTTYAAFKTDATPSTVSFDVTSGTAQGSYKGRLWAVKLRVHVTRTVGSLVCDDFSPAVNVSVVEGVDP